MTTLRPFRRIRQSVAFISLAALLGSQVYLSAADYYLIRRGDGLNSIYSYSEKAYPFTSADTLVVGNLMDGATTLNATANSSLSLVSIGGIRVLNNAGGALTINPNAAGTGTQTLQIGSGGIDMSAASQNLTINGTNTTTLLLGLTSAQSWLVGQGRTLTVGAAINGGANQLTLGGTGTGAFTVSGAINMAAPLVINAQGSGAFNLSGAVNMGNNAINITNTGSSNVTFSGGITDASAINFSTAGAGKLVMSGTLTSAAGTAINLTTFGAGGADLTGVIGGANTALNVVNYSTATTLMQGNHTFGGATNVTGGTMNLKYDVAASGSTPASNAGKLSDSATLTLNRATLTLTTLASGNHDEVIGGLNVGAGYSQITRTAASGRLMANNITRTTGGVLNLGAAGIVTTDRTNINGILGGWATTANGTDWVFNATNGADGLVNTFTGYTSQPTPASWTAGQNILITGSTSASMGTVTINSIKINAGAATTTAQNAGTTWTLDSGGIISAGGGTKTIGSTGAFLTAGTLANMSTQRAGAANSELFFHVSGSAATVDSRIVDNAALVGSPAVGIVKTQTGSLILTADNTNTGGTVIAAGTLQLGTGATGGTTGSLGAGDIINNGTLVLNRSNNITLANNISGIGGLTQGITTSTATLSGVNTFRGVTNISKGVLRAGSSTGFSPFSSVTMGTDASAKLQLNGFNVEIGGISGTGATIGAVELGGNTLTVGGLNTATQTYTGVISGVGGSLVKVGAGALILGSTNTFNGSVTVQGGSLDLPGNNNLNGGATVNSGTLTMAGNNTFGSLVTINGTGTFAGNNTFNGGLTTGTSANLTLGGSNVFNGPATFGQTAVLTFGAATNNAFQALNLNGGSVTMNGTVSTMTALNINNGTLTMSRVGGVVPDNLTVTLGGAGAFLVLNESETMGALAGSYGSQVTIASGKTLDVGTGGLTSAFNGVITGLGTVTKSGAGDLLLGGGNGFSGTFAINAGSVSLNPDTPVIYRPEMISDIGSVTIAAGASLNLLGRTETVGSVSGDGNINLGDGGRLQFGQSGDDTVLGGVISGTGNSVFNKQGTGMTTLTGLNTFLGTLEVSGGTLKLDNASGNALDDSVAVSLRQSAGVLQVGAAGEVVGPVSGAAGSLIQLDGQLVSTNVPGTVIEVVGTATSGSPLWTGFDTNAALPLGVGMKITNSNFVTDPSWVVQISGSDTILLSNPAQNPGGVGTLNFNPVSVLASNTSGTGGFTKNGTGTLVIVGHQTHSGDTVINAGEVQLGGFESGGRFVWQNVFSDNSQMVFGSTGTQIVNMAASASNLFTFERIGSLAGGAGATSTLNLIENSQLGTPTSSNIGTLAFGGDNKSSTFFGSIDGQDASSRVWAIKEGSGVFTYLNNSQSFRGVARVEDGTWRIPASVGSLGLNDTGVSLYLSNKSGAVFDNEITEQVDILAGGAGVRSLNRAGITGALMGNYLNQSGAELKLTGAFSELYVTNATLPSMSFAGRITGDGSLVKTGTSALLLLNENSYTGTTRVEGGSLQLGFLSRTEGVGNAVVGERRGSLSAGTTITLSNGATLNTNSMDTLAANITTGGSAQSITVGRGTLTLTNASGNYRGLLMSGGGLAQTGNGLLDIGLVRVTGGTLNLAGTGQVNGPRLELSNSAKVILDNDNGSNGAALADHTLVRLSDTSMMEFGGTSNGEVFGSLAGSGTVDLGLDRTITLTRPGGDGHGNFTGVITGTGTSGLVLEGRGALILSGTNTYNGVTRIGSGSELILNGGAGSGTSTILSDSSNVVLAGGTIRMRGDKKELLGSVTLEQGMTTITRDLTSGGKVALGALVIGDGGALMVDGLTATTTLSNGAAGILGGWASYDRQTWAIVPAGAGEQTIEGLASSVYVNTLGAGNHTSVLSNLAANGATTATLNFRDSAADRTVSVDGILMLSEGGIMVTRGAGDKILTLAQAAVPSLPNLSLRSATDQISVHQFNEVAPMVIDIPLDDNGGLTPTSLVKTGKGKLILTAANNQTGVVTIGQGTIQLGDQNGSSGDLVLAGTVSVVNNGILTFFKSTGTILPNPISGTGALRQIGSGNVQLPNSNTYKGRTSVQSGILTAAGANALGSPLGGTTIESGAEVILASASSEPIAIKGGALTISSIFSGPLSAYGTGSRLNVNTASTAELRTSLLTPLQPQSGLSLTFNDFGSGTIKLQGINQIGNVMVKSGRLMLSNNPAAGLSGFIPGGSNINLSTAGAWLEVDVLSPHRVIPNNLSGAGGVRVLSNPIDPTFLGTRQVWLTGNNSYSGETLVGVAVSGAQGTAEAVLHVGADSFSGSIGTSSLTVESTSFGNSQVRTHRYDTLEIPGNVTLLPSRNANGTSGQNADFVKEGMGNVVLSGEITSGPLGPKFLVNQSLPHDSNTNPFISGPERALFTVNGGRLVFSDATLNGTTNSWVGDESGPGPIAINNNAHIEFNAGDDLHTYSLFGALGGGGTWVFNSPGTVRLRNEAQIYEPSSGTFVNARPVSGWSGFAYVHKGLLETTEPGQFGGALDIYLSSAGNLSMSGNETLEVVSSARDATIEIGSGASLRLTGGERFNAGYISGAGNLVLQGSTTHLYTGGSDYTGNTEIVSNALVRATKLAVNGQESSIGSGSDVIFGFDTTNGTLEFIGSGNDTTNRTMTLAGAAGTSGTVQVNGPGTLTLTGPVEGGLTGVDGDGKQLQHTFNLAGDSVGTNVFSGNVLNSGDATSMILRKAGSGTWRMTGNRASFAGPVQLSGGILEIDDIGALGNLGVARTINLNGGTLRRYDNTVSGTETLANNITFLSTGGNSGIINDDANTGLIINGTIAQDTSTGASAATRTITLGGNSGVGNIVNGNITGNNLGLSKTGSSTWTLNGNNTFQQGGTISAGTLVVNGTGGLGDVGNYFLSNSEAVFDSGSSSFSRIVFNISDTIGSLQGNYGSKVEITNPGTTLTLQAGSQTFAGLITGAGGVKVTTNANGAGRVATFTQKNTYSGPTSIVSDVGGNVGGSRIDAYHLANGGQASSIGASGSAASNLMIATKTGNGGLRFIGFSSQSTDRLFTFGEGSGGSGEGSVNIWADGQGAGKVIPTIRFTNTGALAYSGSGARRLVLRGGNRGTMSYNALGDVYAGLSFNEFSPIVADGPGGITSLRKLEDSVWLLKGANTFTGAVSVERGTLSIGHNTALGTSAGGVVVAQANNDTRAFLDLRGVSVSNEALQINSVGSNNSGVGWGASFGNNLWTGTVANNVASRWGILNDRATPTSQTVLRVDGAISGGGAISIVGNGTLILGGSNTFTGQVTAAGKILGLDYSTNNTSKLPDTVALILGGAGNVAVQGASLRGQDGAYFQTGTTIQLMGGSHTEVVSATTINSGASYIERLGGGTSVLQLGALTRAVANGGTLDVATGTATTTTAVTNGMINGYLTVDKTSWAAKTGNSILALGTYVAPGAATATSNVDVTAGGSLSAANSLRFNTAAAMTLSLSADTVVATGGILVTPNVGNNLVQITGSTLTSGTGIRDVIVHQHNTAGQMLIGSTITNNGSNTVSLTKSGLGELILTGNSTYTAGTYVNEGLLRVGQNGSPTTLGTGALTVNSRIIFDHSGAEYTIGSIRGNGVIEFAQTNNRTVVFSGDSTGFGGEIIIGGGTLASNADGLSLGSGRAIIRVTTNDAKVDLRNTNANSDGNRRTILPEMYLAGTLMTSVGTSTFGGNLFITDDQARIENAPDTALTLNNQIYSSVGLTKVGNGRLILNNGNLFADAIDGTTGRNITPNLTGQILVEAGELWTSGGGRSAGATGPGNEIIVSPGATLDLRDADFNYGDDPDANRKWIIAQGDGFLGRGALRNTAGTANVTNLEVTNDITIGTGGFFNGSRIDFNSYDTSLATGSVLAGVTTLTSSTVTNNQPGTYNISKVGTGDLVFRDTLFDSFNILEIKEGELRFERNVPPHVADSSLDLNHFNQIVLNYIGPSVLDATSLNSNTGPVVGSRLEFYRQNNVHHFVPIIMDGDISNTNGGANYLELNSDASVPGPATFLEGGIQVFGPAYSNIFNIDGGPGTGSIAAQGQQTSEVQGKMIIANGIYGPGGISKIGFRELRITDSSSYTGDTVVTRTGTINVPSRSDTVTVNGVAFQTLGEAESWGEFGMTLNGNGRITGTSALRLERNALLTLDNSTRLDASSGTTTTNDNDRIRNAANVFMRMGTIRIIGSATESNAEQIASAGGAKVQLLAGTNTIDLWNSDGSNMDITLTIGELSRNPGSVLRVRALDATSTFSTVSDEGNVDSVRVALTTAPTSGAGLAVTGGSSGITRSIVTGVLGGTAPHTIYADTRLLTDLYAQGRNLQNATGSHFMTYDNGYLRPLDDSEYYVPTNGLVETAGAGGANVNLVDFNQFTRTTTNINSLRFGPTADHDGSGGVAVNANTNLTSYTNNWQPTLYIDDSASLNVASGMISSATFSVGPGPNNTSYIRGGTVNFGAQEGIINNQNYWLRLTDGVYGSNNFEIQSRLAGSGGLTKVGALNIVLDAASTYTGVTTINEGVLFARNGRNAFGANGPGNGIVVQGTGDFRLINGVIIGTAAAPKDLTIGLIVNDGQQILRSENGNNYFYGDLIYDNVDSVLHANPAARPRVTANTNQALTIVGDIYGGTSPVTEDTYYTDSRIITLEGAGFINIRGQVGDRGVAGKARAIEKPITAGRSSATLTNENQVFRLHIASNQDLNVSLDQQYNAAGRLALDQGVLLINYDPNAPGNDGTGFWTTEAITKLAGIPVAAPLVPTAPALADLGNSNSNNYLYTTNGAEKVNEGNNGTSMHGFGMGALNIGAGNQAVFMTKPGQKFNMATWTIGGGGGYAILGGLNNSGTVTYGTGQGTLSLGGRSVRFYASSGGTVDFNYRLNGGSFIKNGLGTIVISNRAVDADITNNSDTQSYELAGGTMIVDMDGPMTVRRVGNAGTFTGSGGTLIGRAFSTGTTATNRTVDISTDTGATRTVRFIGGNTQVIAQAIGVNGMTVTLGNGSNSTAVTRSEGATANFVGYNSTVGGTGVGEVRMNFATGIAHQNPKNHIIQWAVSGTQPRTATDFAMIDANASNRVRPFFRAVDEYKNDVATWLVGEDVSEETLTGSGGSGFRGTLSSSLAVNTIRFDAPASSTLNVGTGQTLQVAQSGIMVSSNTGSAIKTITGGRLTSSTIVAGRLTSGSNLVTNLDSTAGLYVGMPVSGTNISIGTFIQEILPSGTEVRLSSNATATTATAFQGIVFGSTELIVHQFGQGDLVIESGLGDGNSFIGGLSTTSGSTSIGLTTTLGIVPGMVVVGPNIPSGSTVVTVDSSTNVTLSLPATATASGGTLELLPLRTGPGSLASATYGSASTTITVATTAPVNAGMIITGPGIPFGTYVTAVNSATQLTISNPTTAPASNTVLYVTTQNDPPAAVVTVTGGSSTLDSPHFSVSSTASLRVGMGITGTGIPANSVILSIPAYNSSDPVNDTTTFTISQNATVTSSGQTYRGIPGAVNLTAASTSIGSTTITVPSTTGIFPGMTVRLPHIPDNATINTVPNTTTFTITGGTASTTASGLTGYAQYPASMPAVLTGGVTSTGPGLLRLVTVHSTAGLKAGYTVVGPNLASGTVVEQVVNGTQFVVTKDVTAAGTNLTFVVGTQFAMPISMLAAEVRAGSNKVMVASTLGLQEGLILIGPGIPAAAVITSVDSSQGITMSVNATASSSGGVVRAVSPMALTINGPSTTGEGEAGTTGAVVLKSSSGNYGGKTYVNGGVLSISSESSLGIASAVGTNDQLTLNGGTLRWTGVNGQMNPNRGLTIGGNGGVIEIAESTGHLFIRRSIFSQDQYRGDLIKTGPGTLIFEGDNGDQSNFRGLLDIREGTVRMAGDRPDTAAGTSTMFGSNISWADGTIVRNNANLMIQFGNANDSGDYNIEEFITFEGNNGLTVGTPNGPRRPVNWNAPMRINGPLTMDVTLGQIFRLGLGGGYVEGSGDIIKDGTGTLEFRENIPDWKGGLTILQGRVIGLNQADVFGTGHLNGKTITLGSTEHAGDADLYLQSDLGTAGSVWEVNMPINVVYNPAQTKRLGVTTQPNPGGMDFLFNGNITLNDNLVLNYTDTNGATPAGGEIVHMTYNGNISDGAVTSGNLILQTREGNGTTDANGNTNGRFYVYHRFAGNNSGWTGDLVISDNLTYNHDQNTIARFDNAQAIGALNDVIMNYNSMMQIGGNNVTIGSLHTLGGNGPFASNVGTISASQGHSSEVIENGGSTPATLTINQTTPVTSEVKWDAMFRDGNLASHWISPGQSAPAASLSIVKAGEGWATLSLDNDYTGTTTVQTGVLQVGVGGIGDTGALRALNAAGLTLSAGATLAGTGVVHGAAVLNGLLRPGDVAGEAIGTININGNVALGDTSVTTIQVQSAALNVPELMSVPLAGSGPDVNNPSFLSAYALLRNMSLGITDTDSSIYQKEISDPVYSNHHDQVRSSGDISLSDNAKVMLTLEGYTPVAGDVFRVLQAATITAAAGFNVGSQFRYGGESGLDLELPSLGGSFMWDTSLFKTRGIVSVVGIDNGENPTVLAPIFLTRPQHVIVPLDGMANFTVSAFGAGTITYAWKKGTTQVGTGESLSVGPVTKAMVTKYSVTATNSVGSSTSGPVELAALDMTGSSSYLQAGGTKTLTTLAYASSATVLKYQWYKDGIALSNGSKYSGVTTSKLTLKAFGSNEVGNYTCRVSIPGSAVSPAAFLDGGVHQVLLLSKPEFETDVNGALSPLPPSGSVSGAYGPYTVPVKPGVNRAPTKFTATGLPTGVTINATTGVLSGTPDLDKTWTNIKITASNAAGSTTCQPFSIVIAPLPNTAVGAFVGLMDRDATTAPTISFGKGARIDLTTAKKGTFTLKFTNGTTANSATGRLSNLGGAPTASVLVKRKAPLTNLTVTFAIGANNLVTGTVTDGTSTNNFNGWRNIWSSAKGAVNEATTRYGSHNIKAEFTNQDVFPTPGADIGDLTKPQGATTAIIKVVKPGNVTTVMKMGDSTAVASIAAPLGPTGQVFIYKTLYSSKQQGTVHGQASIAEDSAHTTTGSMTWSKPAPATTTVAKLYHNGWPAAPLALTIGGGIYLAPLALKPPTVPVGEIVMSLPAQANNAQLNFEYGKVDTAANFGDLDIPFTVASTAKVTIPAYNVNGVPSNPNPATLKMTTLNAATGEFVGTATMRDIDTNTGKPVTRTLSYRGLIIPNVNTPANLKDGIGVGYFTLRELPIVSPEIQNAGVVTFDVAP